MEWLLETQKVPVIYLIVWLHWIADFILQSNWMAQNKSKRMDALLIHGAIYSLPFMLLEWKYALINAGIHCLVDFFTSRASGWFYRKGDTHNFFIVIGFDQAVHLTTLVLTWKLLNS